MENHSESYVALFAALANELSKAEKKWLVLQLADLLASRISANGELGANSAEDEKTALVSKVLGSMVAEHPALSSRLGRAAAGNIAKAKSPTPLKHRDIYKDEEAAKRVIHQKFESWCAVKTGRHWHAGFARKMVELHNVDERAVQAWARVWEQEASHRLRGR